MSSFVLAGLNLLHQRLRTLISLAGVGFAVVLVFMQLGFLGSVERTATLLFNRLDFDLLLTSREYLDLNRPASLPRRRLAEAHAAPGVAEVRPVTLGMGQWRDPRPPSVRRPDPRRWNILIVAVPPDDLGLAFRNAVPIVFPSVADLARYQTVLARPNAVLIDRQSRPEFGTPDDLRPGGLVELNERQVELAGSCNVGTGFGYNGLLLASEATLARVTGRPAGEVTFGLVKLAPGADLRAVRDRLNDHFADATAYTRDEINARETDFWVQTTAVGRFFTLGVALSVVVGVIFVYQMIAADIRNHLPEYATCKAIGYRNRFLTRVVLWQANLLALVGFVPGLLVSLAIYELTRQAAHIPIGMTATRMVGVLLLTLGMCLCSGLLALRKLRSAEPADLF